MFGSENVQTIDLVIDADPVGGDDLFYLMKAPRALTVTGFWAVSDTTKDAGTAVTLSLQNWGTAGTAVEGTVSTLGGTAAAQLVARTPQAGALDATHRYFDEGEWMAIMYAEIGAGWAANDRVSAHVHYVYGKA